MSLIPNLFTAYNAYDHNIGFLLDCPAGCHNYKNRNKIALTALETKSDYTFMVDTDMVFPDDTLLRLLRANKDIIGTTYNKRSMPITPIHNTLREDMGSSPFPINAIPTGVILIKTKVFQTMEPPWFAVEWIAGLEFVGPDIYFCRKAIEYGFTPWLDPTIEVKHIGDYKY